MVVGALFRTEQRAHPMGMNEIDLEESEGQYDGHH
jgi:hypothetical protein